MREVWPDTHAIGFRRVLAIVRGFGRDAVVTVGLFVVVGPVDPADDVLGCVALVECVGQPADLFSHARTVTEELLVAVVGVFGGEQEQLVGELDEHLDVIVSNVLGGANPVAENVDVLGRGAAILPSGSHEALNLGERAGGGI